jgi:hypothetical protein
MKRIIKRILFFISILFLLIFVVNNKLIALRSEQNIGKYILKNTPLGSSKDDVRAFIGKKGYEIWWDRNRPHTLIRGITLPREDYVYPRDDRGASNIYVIMSEIFGPNIDIVTVVCVWVFDEDEKLILIDVSKEWNSL